MLQSLWLRLRGSRSLLPMRDLFDADLDRARRKPGCAICRLVQEHNQHSMHSFLWEYCTDPHVGMSISKSWGFCPFHAWSLAILEHDRMGDGLGITIVYQALLRQFLGFFSSQSSRKQIAPPLIPKGPRVGSANCRFCQAAQSQESLFLSRLEKRFQQVINSDNVEDWSSLRTTLCLPHMQEFLQRCMQEAAIPAPRWYSSFRRRGLNGLHKASWLGEIQLLTTHMSQTTLQCLTGLSNGAQTTQPVWSQVTQQLALLVGDQGALPALAATSIQQIAPPQLLLVTSRRSQLQSPSNEACPVCSAEASACIERYLHLIDPEAANTPMIGSFCQRHHWILAASIVLQQQTECVGYYLSWIEEQIKQHLAALNDTHDGTLSHGKGHCIACSLAAEVGSEMISSMVQELRQNHDHSPGSKGRLLCLYHWSQAHVTCSSESDALNLQQRLLEQQLQRLTALDRCVEAYLARFNAAKRERGEVPDILEAAWAWERLLAFFVGEPTLVYRLADN